MFWALPIEAKLYINEVFYIHAKCCSWLLKVLSLQKMSYDPDKWPWFSVINLPLKSRGLWRALLFGWVGPSLFFFGSTCAYEQIFSLLDLWPSRAEGHY